MNRLRWAVVTAVLTVPTVPTLAWAATTAGDLAGCCPFCP